MGAGVVHPSPYPRHRWGPSAHPPNGACRVARAKSFVSERPFYFSRSTATSGSRARKRSILNAGCGVKRNIRSRAWTAPVPHRSEASRPVGIPRYSVLAIATELPGSLVPCAVSPSSSPRCSRSQRRPSPPDRLVVFAAASLKTALDAAAGAYRAGGGGEVAISYGGSLGLARQIVAGAPADIFASADEESMDEAVKGGAIPRRDPVRSLEQSHCRRRAESRCDRCARARPRRACQGDRRRAAGDGRGQNGADRPIRQGFADQARAMGYRRAASGDDRQRARRARLRRAWRGAARHRLRHGRRGRACVKIVATFPDDSHPPITYPFAIAAASHDDAAASFLGFLKSPAAGGDIQVAGLRPGRAVRCHPRESGDPD